MSLTRRDNYQRIKIVKVSCPEFLPYSSEGSSKRFPKGLCVHNNSSLVHVCAPSPLLGLPKLLSILFLAVAWEVI
jgi:hypothetical protein